MTNIKADMLPFPLGKNLLEQSHPMQLYCFPEEKLRCGLAHRPYQSQTVGPSEFLSEKESMEIINWITQRIK